MSAGSRLSRTELEALVPDVATGLRAAIATVVPLAYAHAHPQLAWTALGGWLGTLADPGGSRIERAKILIAFTLFGSLGIAIGASVHSVIGAVILVASAGFAATLLRALGAASSALGTLLALVVAVGTASHSSTPLPDGLWFGAGSTIALFLSSIVWPIFPHLQMRRAVARVFEALGAYAAAIEACMTSEDDWSAIGRRHARDIREAIDAARATSLAIRARRAGESGVGSNLRVLLGMAESQFLLLVTLAARLEGDRDPRAIAFLRSLAARFAAIRDSVIAPITSADQILSARPAEGDGLVVELANELAIESAASLALAIDLDRTDHANDTSSTWFQLTLDGRELLDALSPRSPLLHHAIRVAVAAAAAVAVGALFSPMHAAWVSVTALVVLQPFTGATVKRAAERVVGTVLGALVAIAIMAARPGPFALALIMFPLSVAAVVTKPRSYRLFTLFLTPIFVLVATHTTSDWWVAAARAGDTLAGGAIALLAAALIFPHWEERVGLPEAVAEMRQACEAYAREVCLPTRDSRRIDESRLRAAASINRAEASLERVLADPLRARKATPPIEPVTYARRLALAATTLDTIARKESASRKGALESARADVARFGALLKGLRG